MKADDCFFYYPTEPKVFPYQAEACQGTEAEPPCAPMDSPPYRQRHSVRFPPNITLNLFPLMRPRKKRHLQRKKRRGIHQEAGVRYANVNQNSATTPSVGTGARPVSVSKCHLFPPFEPFLSPPPDYQGYSRNRRSTERCSDGWASIKLT